MENRLNKDSQEFTILCAKETEKVLREQVEKLKAELASIDGALNDPRANLTLTTSEIIWELKDQLAALAEQNERMREALEAISCNLGTGKLRSISEKLADDALSIPNLATPILNRIRAEGVRKASTLVSLVRNDWASAGDNLSVQAAEYLIYALDARAAELEKTND